MPDQKNPESSENVVRKYEVLDSAFGKIRNKNEKRVKKMLFEMLKEFEWHQPDILDLQDIYALALNILPARYSQEFSVVLKEPVTDDQIQKAIRKAAVKVLNNPKHNR